MHFSTDSRHARGYVFSTLHDHRVNEVFVEVVDIFDEATFRVCRDHRVVKEREVSHQFTQAHPTRVGADDHTKLCR